MLCVPDFGIPTPTNHWQDPNPVGMSAKNKFSEIKYDGAP